MNKRFKILPFLIFYSLITSAQTATKDVSSLVAAENYFAGISEQKGIKEAFLKVCNDETIVFRPDPVKAISFYKKQQKDTSSSLAWQPVMARISRNGDWGFTTGSYKYRMDKANGRTLYGEYLSVWQTDKKGVWKLALDLGIEHNKSQNNPKMDFLNPYNTRFYANYSDARLRQRADIVTSTDKLLATSLKAKTELGYSEFASDDIHFLFPGNDPIIGKTALLNFLKKQHISISTDHAVTNRALGGDLAYTYGKATVKTNGISKPYNYVRIWEIQDGFRWNVLVEVLSPAGEKVTNVAL